MLGRLWKKLTGPTEFEKAMDAATIEGLKADPEALRREVLENPFASRERCTKHRIWIDAHGAKIPFEHLSNQRLINILVFQHSRAYKKALGAYFDKMIGVASDPYYYAKGLDMAACKARDLQYDDPIALAIVQELVARGRKIVGEELNQAFCRDEGLDPDVGDPVPY